MNEKNSLKDKILILLGALVIIVLVILVALDQRQKRGAEKITKITPIESSTNSTSTSGEIAISKSAISNATVTPEVLKEAQVIANGTSLVTSNNIVVTPQGAPVKLNVVPASADAPKESTPVDINKIPDNANTIKMTISAAGFVPNTFTVKEGQLVDFVLTSTDDFSHMWALDDLSLKAAMLGVAKHETRMKLWNAPQKGTYTFSDTIRGHAARGEVGTMIVE